jgi:hypothetical protein
VIEIPPAHTVTSYYSCIPLVFTALLAGILSAAEPEHKEDVSPLYRIIFRNTSGQISLPDEPRHKTYFIDLAKAGKKPNQFFGGPERDRFKVLQFVNNNQLVCEEVKTKRIIKLDLGKEFIIEVLAPPK